MAESRYKKRHRRRISLNFGISKAEKFGFTDDINHESGLIALLGEVRWTKKVTPNILHKLKGGMGVRIISFLSGEELYHALCDELVEQRGS